MQRIESAGHTPSAVHSPGAASDTAPMSRSPLRRALFRLRRNRLAMLGFWILILLYGSALFADFLAPYHYASSARKKAYHPPDDLLGAFLGTHPAGGCPISPTAPTSST